MIEILSVDVHDDAALQAWYAVESASLAHDRPDASHRTITALAAYLRNPSRYRRYMLLAAQHAGETVGTAELTLRDEENAHALELEIHVHPDHRRRGIGRRLWEAADAVRIAEGRTTTFGELSVPPEAALAFATSLGFESVHEEDHLVLDLPHQVEQVATPGYEILTWVGPCPDELLGAYVRLRNQMETDVPIGEVDLSPTVHTAERIREQEQRTARSYDRVTAAAREQATGDLVAYSLVYLPHDSSDAIQDDTLVMPDHRGHRLGHALKRNTLEVVTRDHQRRTMFHTWTDPDNAPMQRTNAAFGYRPVERIHEVQRKD